MKRYVTVINFKRSLIPLQKSHCFSVDMAKKEESERRLGPAERYNAQKNGCISKVRRNASGNRSGPGSGSSTSFSNESRQLHLRPLLQRPTPFRRRAISAVPAVSSLAWTTDLSCFFRVRRSPFILVTINLANRYRPTCARRASDPRRAYSAIATWLMQL